jgi:acyl carrier protein
LWLLNFLANQGRIEGAGASSAMAPGPQREASVPQPDRDWQSHMSASTVSDLPGSNSEGKIAKVVHRLLLDHSIDRTFYANDDLREVGLTSLDMASLVLSVEAEFDVMIPERQITPANFRSVSTITSLVTGLLNSKARTASTGVDARLG